MNCLNILVIGLLILACGVLDLMVGRYRPAGLIIMAGTAISSASGYLWIGTHTL